MGENELIACLDSMHLIQIKSKTMILDRQRETIQMIVFSVHTIKMIKLMKTNSSKNLVSHQAISILVHKLKIELFSKTKIKSLMQVTTITKKESITLMKYFRILLWK